MLHTKTIVRGCIVLVVLAGMACARGGGSTQGAGGLVAADLAGGWVGTAEFFDDSGSLVGSSPDWAFTVEVDAAGRAAIVHGPTLEVQDDGTVTLGTWASEPAWPPGQPGRCGPLFSEVRGGSGQLVGGGLRLVVSVRVTCGEYVSNQVRVFEMQRASAPVAPSGGLI